MDFGTLLTVAQKNDNNKQQPIACYQTKFTPAKKQTKQSRSLSENIKKFLAKKEEEERQKALEEKKKKENLLALRDHKAQSRINKHLKVCKAANKSVLADAIDNQNTAVTIAGPSQPDEDDYGYVSQEATAFYAQLMNKYNNLPPEKPIFNTSDKKTVKDIASTKDRVKQALKQQEIEESLGHRRKRKSSSLNTKEAEPEEKKEKLSTSKILIQETEESSKSPPSTKPKPKKKPMPPPMDFGALLKLAEKKQHEPIVLDVKPKVEEPERLMTKKQMKEYMKEKEWRERKDQYERNQNGIKKTNNSYDTNKLSKPQINKPAKNNDKLTCPSQSKNIIKPSIPLIKKITEKAPDLVNVKGNSISKVSSIKNSSMKDELLEERKQLEAEKRKLEEMRKAIEEEKQQLAQSKMKQEDTKLLNKVTTKTISHHKHLGKQITSKDIKPNHILPVEGKSKQSAIPNGKLRQYSDLKNIKHKESDAKVIKKASIQNKRRIYDDDEEEYDPELDDFIDDSTQEETEDYSKYISEIFGYNKNKYTNIDDDDDDDAAMESNFAQQLKEEYVSTKIGIMEDLEDIRIEEEEKKRKALKKKIKK